MRRRVISLSLFLFVSFLFLLFSKTFISSPLYFFASLTLSPRALLYNSVHAETKLTELDLLAKENTKLRQQLVTLDSLKKDNDALRSQFQDTTIPSQKLIPSKIVGFGGSIERPTSFILDQGEKSNIKKGMAVVVGGVLIGKIAKTSQWYCEAQLVTNQNFSTLAVTSLNNSSGIVNGQTDFILLSNVVITDTLSKDETVVTKGELDNNGIGIPSGLMIGKITAINKSDAKPFQSAVVQSPIDFKKLTTVFILTQ